MVQTTRLEEQDLPVALGAARPNTHFSRNESTEIGNSVPLAGLFCGAKKPENATPNLGTRVDAKIRTRTPIPRPNQSFMFPYRVPSDHELQTSDVLERGEHPS